MPLDIYFNTCLSIHLHILKETINISLKDKIVKGKISGLLVIMKIQ